MESIDLYDEKYGDVQPRTIPEAYESKIEEWLQPQQDDVILEVGTAGGSLLDFLKQHSNRVIGSDLNISTLVKAGNTDTVATDARQISIKDNSVDKSVSLHTLEHVDDLDAVFKELDRISKDRGLSLHAFPAFLVTKAEGAIIDAWKMTHNPVKAWNIAHKLHIHDLNPDKIEEFIKNTNWKLIKSEKLFVRGENGFAWVVLLKKQNKVVEIKDSE